MMEEWQHRKHNDATLVQHVFARLAHSHELEVVVNEILDRRDALDRDLRTALGNHPLASAAQLAEFQAAQGALLELGKLAASLWALGTDALAKETRDQPRRNVTIRPAPRARI